MTDHDLVPHSLRRVAWMTQTQCEWLAHALGSEIEPGFPMVLNGAPIVIIDRFWTNPALDADLTPPPPARPPVGWAHPRRGPNWMDETA